MASFAIELTHSISVIIAFCSIFNVLFGKKVFFAILKKELNHFLGSYIGYFAIIGFLILNGFFLWMNTGNNILDYGIAELDLLFETAPLIMLLLIPAITMRSLAEEYSNGTIEFLLTKPISKAQILLGKFLACLSIIALAILPTLVYVFTIYELGSPIGNLDTGATISSYIGLICLGAAFAAIGIFASAVSKNQIIAFILGIFVCYFTYRGFDDISRLPLFFGKSDDIIQSMGLSHHFMAIRKGVLDTRDLIYFISFTALFLTLSNKIISWRK
jgi:ABC-2 type transport system permease protein